MDFDSYISNLNSDLRILKGVGEKKSALFAKMNINTIWDLIHCFPRTYEDRTVFYKIVNAPVGENCCIKASVVMKPTEKKIKRNISLYILKISDGSDYMTVKWFSSPFNKSKIVRGAEYVFYGYISRNGTAKEMDLKAVEQADKNCDTGCIVPIYALTSGLTQNDFKKSVSAALSMFDNFIDSLPKSVICENNLMNKNRAIREMHHPRSFETLKTARRSLAFEELFTLTLALKKIRKTNDAVTDVKIKNVKCAAEFADLLPFELTGDQKKVINEICSDFLKNTPMNRLLQGDVGSGKTAVAAAAAYVAGKNGFQTAFMAPTELLARQHYEALTKFFKGTGIITGILTSSVKDKKQILFDIETGKYDVVVGTHALIEDGVNFDNLGLCITDEQHRFGVKQRAKLSNDKNRPHVLVMSATPIPRTLSLIIYGDLDISVIKSLPKNRQVTETYLISPDKRNRMYEFMRRQIESGRQCFVVCPLVEESDKLDAIASTEIHEFLRKVFPEYNIGLVHGKMKSDEKDAVMENFRNCGTQILVSTTVIEVGIDIPNATVMVIENAERFGLSQLHQLRGRVGRGGNKSYCILVSECNTDESRKRMTIMCSSSDGFEIAQKDLEMRGCGEFFGTRQHGLPELKVANLFTDSELVKTVAEACDKLIKSDPDLSSDELVYIKGRIKKLFAQNGGLEIFN